jgi:hypothetical protein
VYSNSIATKESPTLLSGWKELPPVMSERFSTKHKQADPNIELLKTIDAQGTAKVPKVDHDARHNNKGHMFYLGAAGLAASLAATGIFVGSKFMGSEANVDDKAPVNKEPGISAPLSPGTVEEDTTSAKPSELTVERYNNGEAIMTAWNESYNDWIMAGATEEMYDNEDILVDRDDYIVDVTTPLDEAYLSTYFISDWKERPDMVAFAEEITAMHTANLHLYMSTFGIDPKDTEPYEQSRRLTSTNSEVISDDQIETSYRYVREDNSSKNRGEELLGSKVDGVEGGATILWQKEDGVWKIASIIL